MDALIVIGGSLLNVFGTFFYVRDTLRGITKPNRMTWLMWSIAPLIGAAAAFTSGVTWAVLPVFMTGVLPFLVFLSSFVNKHSYWQLTAVDYFCGACSALALILWAITKDPIIAIFFAILGDFAAGFPTLIKAWRFPETENGFSFLMATLSVATSFFVATPSLSAYAFPAYLFCINALLALGAYRKRLFQS